MKIRYLPVLLALAASLLAQAGKVVQAFQDQDLGKGYQLKWRHVDLTNCQPCFEGMAHYTDLYWHGKKIAESVGAHFVSPTGEYALFEQNGKLLLFVASTQKMRDVTDGVFGVPQSVKWQEKEKRAVVAYYGKHEPTSIRLDSE